jgi:hypothetical protein
MTPTAGLKSSLLAEVDYLNADAPQPIETPITFVSTLFAGDASGVGRVDVNDLTIVLT